MKVSTRTRYALRLLIDIGIRQDKEFVAISEISDAQDISLRYAEQILLTLKNAGILGSRRGIGGGFYFVKDPAEITVYDIYRVLDGKPELSECLSEERGCEREDICVTREVWTNVQKAIIEEMKKFNLKELIEKQKKITEERNVEKWKGSYI